MGVRILLLLLLLFLSGCSYQYGLRESNDFFTTGGRSDYNFTQGLGITAQRKLDQNTTEQIEVGQDLYTPDDLRATEVVENENPYAGWLYGKYGIAKSEGVSRTTNSISLGIVGPSAQGEVIQTEFHKLIDSTIPEGWDNQLNDEIGLIYEHKKFSYFDAHQIDLFGYGLEHSKLYEYQVRLGNIHTDAQVVFGWKLGRFLEEKSFDIHALWGFEARALNIFYDGNNFSDSHSVTKEILVSQINVGACVDLGLQVCMDAISRSRDYEEQGGSFHTYGILSFSCDL